MGHFSSTYFVSQTQKGTVSVFMASNIQRIELKSEACVEYCIIKYN